MFFDFEGIGSGDFERLILENINARAHFLVLLTPSALEHCDDPEDWLRREIETAVDTQRNIVPLMLEGFDFNAPAIASRLTGKLAMLKGYNGLPVPVPYFAEAMGRLREKYLNVPLDAVLHPASSAARQSAKAQQAAASTAPVVQEKELTAPEWFEKGFDAVDPHEKLRCYGQAILLKPDYADAYYYQGLTRHDQGDRDGALRDYSEAIRLNPNFPAAYYSRGCMRQSKFLMEGALQDYAHVIRLKPDFPWVYYNRGLAREWKKKDLDGALGDYNEAIRLKPDFADAYYLRAIIWEGKANYIAAIADFQKYLDEGGSSELVTQAEVEQRIRDLRKKL